MISLFHKISGASAKLITKEYSTSFSIAVMLLGPSIRQAIYNIYAFVRVADEIVDTFHDYPQEELLDRFVDDYRHAIKTGISANPILNAFQETVKKYNIDAELVDAFLNSMRADLTKQIYTDKSETAEYIYGSADVVGLMCLKVFVNGNDTEYQKLKQAAMKLGSAFQKVNFLRDLNHDFITLNRSYFPNIDPANFSENEKQQLIAEIETEFKEAYTGIQQLPQNSKIGVYVAYKYFYGLLNKIKATPANVLMSKRIRLSNPHKLVLIMRCYISQSLNVR